MLASRRALYDGLRRKVSRMRDEVSAGDRYYRSCGLRIRSDTALPGPLPTDVSGSDLRYLSDGEFAVPDDLPPGDPIVDTAKTGERVYCGTRHGDGWTLRFPGRAEFRVAGDLSVVRYATDPRQPAAAVPVLLAGTVLAFVLSLRGTPLLHATAVAHSGRTLAIVGHSGAGKSTLAQAALKAGALLVAEDVLALEVPSGGPLRCLRGNGEVRLRDGAASLLQGGVDATVERASDDRLVVHPDMVTQEASELTTVVVPARSRDRKEMSFERLDPARALVGLLSIPRIIGFDLPSVVQVQFAAISELVNRVPVYVMHVPEGPPFPSSLGADVLSVLAS